MAIAHLSRPWPAPAKLNRLLRIIGRRSDGYHLLQTVFQFLECGDQLRFKLRTDGEVIRLNSIPGVPASDDLVVRAARLLQARCKVKQGASIEIDKVIPLGAGLGGGSSDAATTLVALNHYWKTQLSCAELAELGLQLGADVPVFVHGQAAWAEGVGEVLCPLTLDEPWFVVIVPPCQVETASIFADPQLTRDSEPLKMRAFASDESGNDCEPVVYRRYPQVAAAARWLAQHGCARLTGTGAGVFAAFERRVDAARVFVQLPDGWRGFLSRGCNRSSLHERLHSEHVDESHARSLFGP